MIRATIAHGRLQRPVAAGILAAGLVAGCGPDAGLPVPQGWDDAPDYAARTYVPFGAPGPELLAESWEDGSAVVSLSWPCRSDEWCSVAVTRDAETGEWREGWE